jgi:hypothetical protein
MNKKYIETVKGFRVWSQGTVPHYYAKKGLVVYHNKNLTALRRKLKQVA